MYRTRNLHCLATYIVLLLLALIKYGLSGAIDLDRSMDAFGREFFIVVPVEADINVRSIHNIFLSSRSSEIVQANITRPDLSWAGVKIRIQPNIVSNVTLNMSEPIRNPFNPSGITFQINSTDDVSVWVVPGRGDLILGGYRAIPRRTLGRNYAGVMYPSLPGYTSEMIVFNPSKSPNQIEFTQDDAKFNLTINRTTLSGPPPVIQIPGFNSAKIVSASDLSGFSISSTEPMSLVSGRQCRSDGNECASLMEQVAPLGAWGEAFVIVPQVSPGPQTSVIRVVAAFNDTVIYSFTSSGALKGSWPLLTPTLITDLEVNAGNPFTIRSSKPVMVTQFFTDGQMRLDYASMLSVPPVEQFTNSTVVFYALNDTIFRNTLVVVTRCEHRRDILLNNQDITNEYKYSVKFSTLANPTVHGTYCVFNTSLLRGSHVLKLRDNPNPGAAYSAILYGRGARQAYAYQVAADYQELICDANRWHIELCRFYVPPDYTTPESENGTTIQPTDPEKAAPAPNHTVAIVVVLVVLSSLALIIVVIVVLGSCGKGKGPNVAWRRLQNSGGSDVHFDPSYDEEGGVRMDSV